MTANRGQMTLGAPGSLARALVVAGCALGLAAGCGPKKKIEECRLLVKAINDGVDKIHTTLGGAPDGEPAQSVPKLRALATDMDAVAKSTQTLALSVPELTKLRTTYVELAANVATHARELADAAVAVDLEKLDKLQSQMKATVKGEDPLIEELNTFCQSP